MIFGLPQTVSGERELLVDWLQLDTLQIVGEHLECVFFYQKFLGQKPYLLLWRCYSLIGVRMKCTCIYTYQIRSLFPLVVTKCNTLHKSNQLYPIIIFLHCYIPDKKACYMENCLVGHSIVTKVQSSQHLFDSK